MGWGPERDLGEIARRFAHFASSFPGLDLYHRLAEGCAADPEVARLLTAARPGQERPVLLFAAVHDLVLRRPELDLANWYASVTPAGALATDDPWPVFRRTVLEHRSELEAVIATHATQTNEVNRATILATLLAEACRDVAERPVSLLELGASAGLLLGVDRYRVEVGDSVVGDADSPVVTAASWEGDGRADLSGFPTSIVERRGIDRDPVPLGDTDRVRWLEACLWPDQPWRIVRFRAAVERLRAEPPEVVAGDMIDDFASVVSTLRDDTHLVVFDCWALTYVARDRRPLLAETIAGAAGSGRPVSWITAEPPGGVPGVSAPQWDGPEEATPDTVLGVRRWRDGAEAPPRTLGWAHPHGDWIRVTS